MPLNKETKTNSFILYEWIIPVDINLHLHSNASIRMCSQTTIFWQASKQTEYSVNTPHEEAQFGELSQVWSHLFVFIFFV